MASRHETARPALLEEALAFGGPIVVFDQVSLAFDEKVILREVSFTLQTGHTKIFLGASGAGKSTILRLTLGLLKPDGGRIFVNGEQIEGMDEDQLITVRSDLGRVFQEGALFDSLTVAENVGYKLYEESDMPLDEVARRVEEVLAYVGLGRFDKAVEAARRALRKNQNFSSTYRCLASALAHLGRTDEAKSAAARLLEIDPGFRLSEYLKRGGKWRSSAYIEGLRKAGLPE